MMSGPTDSPHSPYVSSPASMTGYPQVCRLQALGPERFEQLIKSHLTHLLDLPGAALEEFLHQPSCGASSTATPRQPAAARAAASAAYSRLLALPKGKKRHATAHTSNDADAGGQEGCGVLGKQLTSEIVDAVLPLIAHLSQPQYVSEEGIFRKCGNERRKRQLVAALNGGRVRVELGTGTYSAHDCSEVLKLFLQRLPEPLLTQRHHMAYCQLAGFESERKKLRTIQLLLRLLPKENYTLLRRLLHLLHAVGSQASSRMTSETLGLLFAPHVLTSRPADADTLREQVTSGRNASLMAFFIEHAHDIFKLPDVLLRDVQQCLERLEKTAVAEVDGSPSLSTQRSRHSSSRRIPVKSSALEDAVQTCVTFADREASAHSSDYTQLQLAALYAHIGSMPDCAKKRRYAKRVTESNSTPGTHARDRHRRSKSIGDMLRRFVGGSSHSRPSHLHSTGLDISLSPGRQHPSTESVRRRYASPHSATTASPSPSPRAKPTLRLFQSRSSESYTSQSASTHRASPSEARPGQEEEAVFSGHVMVIDMLHKDSLRLRRTPRHGKRLLPGSCSPIKPSRSTEFIRSDTDRDRRLRGTVNDVSMRHDGSLYMSYDSNVDHDCPLCNAYDSPSVINGGNDSGGSIGSETSTKTVRKGSQRKTLTWNKELDNNDSKKSSLDFRAIDARVSKLQGGDNFGGKTRSMFHSPGSAISMPQLNLFPSPALIDLPTPESDQGQNQNAWNRQNGDMVTNKDTSLSTTRTHTRRFSRLRSATLINKSTLSKNLEFNNLSSSDLRKTVRQTSCDVTNPHINRPVLRDKSQNLSFSSVKSAFRSSRRISPMKNMAANKTIPVSFIDDSEVTHSWQQTGSRHRRVATVTDGEKYKPPGLAMANATLASSPLSRRNSRRAFRERRRQRAGPPRSDDLLASLRDENSDTGSGSLETGSVSEDADSPLLASYKRASATLQKSMATPGSRRPLVEQNSAQKD